MLDSQAIETPHIDDDLIERLAFLADVKTKQSNANASCLEFTRPALIKGGGENKSQKRHDDAQINSHTLTNRLLHAGLAWSDRSKK